MKTMKHPTLDGVSVEVDDKQVDEWKAAGWKQSSEKTANADPKPADKPAVSA